MVRSTRKNAQGESAAHFGDEDDLATVRKRFQDVEERRLKEWENYQRSHRSSLEQTGARAFLDINIGEVPAGRLVIELYEDAVPLTVEHFRSLIMGTTPWDVDSNGPKLDYIDSTVSRVDKANHFLMLGEFQGASISPTGEYLKDENFAFRHTQRGILSMASKGPNTVGSAFTITTDAAPSLDFKQVVFGKVVDGLQVLEKMETVATTSRTGIPTTAITVAFCGALTGPKPPGQFELKSSAKRDSKAGADSLETLEIAPAAGGAEDGDETNLATTAGNEGEQQDVEKGTEGGAGDDEEEGVPLEGSGTAHPVPADDEL